MKTVIIYKSKTGFTKKYAQWIAEALSADVFDATKVDIDMIKQYDNIIYGGSLYAAGITGLKFITKNFDKLKDKKLVIFATGASPSSQRVIDEVVSKNFTSEQQKYIKFFYFRGGFDYKKLNFFDKFLMNLLKLKIKSKAKDKLTKDEIGMLSIYDRPTDFSLRKNIDVIVSYLQG
ncbi:flavodoxin domain-containing protein [Clostridium omnivorum]|uniref:Flavodoxin n=1 Tax=Clostridium omnivorum TaxID=1604902 RepID=A0ABQ5NBR7_9CLOT|nr:flavodoxin domain-containing protein [Clostridium sp. E14]GLC32648.1 flavodoxin [Clostridium sp. E14]